MPGEATEGTAALRPYLTRLQLQWLAESPDDPYREVDGTVVFVDISGFTKLSEKLATLGKLGAEELADAIGATFARLLAVAYGEGGNLIKFGGDALLLLFTGDDHPRRATRAAVAMRRTLREIGRLETSGGRIALRMSVGVHTGTYHVFVVGDSHRELMITGPAATRVVEMESAADAGEILVSPQTAALLPRSTIGEPKGPGLLVRAHPGGIGLPADTRELQVPDDLIEMSIPTATREHLKYGSGEPEHRQVTIAFVHFDGTDELLAMHGPAFLAKGLDELVRDIQAAVDAQGICFLGSDVDRDGGKVILTAGAPAGSGNDDERMLLSVRRIAERPAHDPRPDRRESRTRLRGRHRPPVPADLHGDGRRREPRRPRDVRCGAGSRPRHGGGPRTIPHVLRDDRPGAVPREGQVAAGPGLRAGDGEGHPT